MGLPRKRESRDGVSFDKLRTNDLLIYLSLSARGRGDKEGIQGGASFDKLRTNDLLIYLPLLALRERGCGVMQRSEPVSIL